MNIKEQIRAEIEQQKAYSEQMIKGIPHDLGLYYVGWMDLASKLLVFLDFLKEQPVSDHHEIEVEFRGEKVTISREFYRDGEMNYSTSEQDDNAIWSALRAWCEKKGITPFELYPKQSEQPVEGLEEEMFKEWGTTKEEYLAKSMDKVHLEMEIATYLQDWEDDDEIGLHLSTDEGCMPIELEDVRDLARHFAEWGRKQVLQEIYDGKVKPVDNITAAWIDDERNT